MVLPGEMQSNRTIRIGRSPDSDVVLDFPIISWEHARVSEVNGEYLLEDLHSRNGTALNQVNNKVTQSVIKPQDVVYFGSLKVPVSQLLAGKGASIGLTDPTRVALREEAILLGRDPECDHPLNDPLVSWHHARIKNSGGNFYVEDLSSLNGTFVDGARVSGNVEVKPGQEIELGKFHFRIGAG